MKKSRLIFIYFCFFLLTSVGVFYTVIFSGFCLSFGMFQENICREFSSEYLYNQALEKAKTSDFLASREILSHISPESFSKKSAYYELFGDMLYISSGSMDNILTNYKKSFDLKKDERVEKKIALLENNLSGEKNMPSSFSG